MYGVRDRASVRLCGCAAAVINVYGATIAGFMSQNLHKDNDPHQIFLDFPKA